MEIQIYDTTHKMHGILINWFIEISFCFCNKKEPTCSWLILLSSYWHQNMRIFWHPKENLILKRLLFRLNAPTPNVFIINFSRLVSGMLRLVSGISLLVNWEIDVNRKAFVSNS
ncbi:putative cyclin-B3-1 isoform X3 [Papaver somniferum]|uniref:putative cyclin-B3-1 isoform X3 n=1 Tax=Papaver somniferum TaxID=3469 RepID=UPI000E6FA463|nr:putative cyclin-B3-1 isoform X3 [Papaver somniferum]